MEELERLAKLGRKAQKTARRDIAHVVSEFETSLHIPRITSCRSQIMLWTNLLCKIHFSFFFFENVFEYKPRMISSSPDAPLYIFLCYLFSLIFIFFFFFLVSVWVLA